MKRYITIFMFVSCLVNGVKGQDGVLSLTDCIQLAIKNNPTLMRDELAVSRAELAHKQAQYNRLPSLNANLSHDLSQGRSIDPTTNQYIDNNNSSGSQSLNLSIPVFNGFSIIHDIRMKANATRAGKLEFEGLQNNLKLDVIEAYIKVLTSQDMLKQVENRLTVTQEQLHRNEVLNKEGAIAPGNLYDMRGQYGSELNELELTKQSLNNAKIDLAGILNISVQDLPEIEALEMPTEFNALTSEALFEQSLQSLPQFKAMDWRIREMEQLIKVARADYYPSLSLNSGLRSNYSKGNGNTFTQIKNNLNKGVGVTLSIPIFNAFRTRSNVRSAKIELEQAIFNKEILGNELRMETARAVFDLKINQLNVKNLRDQEINYKEAFRIASVLYEEGNSNSVLYLTAKNKLDNARSQLIIKQYELLMQKYINDYYAGSLDL